jgi:SAM-dependent methyltransferase
VFLERPDVPVHQNVLCADPLSAVGMARGDLRMVICERCGFVSNAAFDGSRLSYGPDYENSQYSSAAFREHTASLVRHLVADRGVRNARVLEVGCGNGLFLNAVVEAGEGNVGVGFDPSYRGPATAVGGRVRFESTFFGPESTIDADVVICRHVIEHIPEPLALLKTIRQTLDASGDATVYFETPCVSWIFQHQAFWDFFYEHCSYFSAPALRCAFEAAAFQVNDVRMVFGGQYLWIEARAADRRCEEAVDATQLARQALAFGRQEAILVEQWRNRVSSLARRGAVALWGAGAKGVTLANLVDPRRELLACVVDENPEKQGHFLPGTGHPIVAARELVNRAVASIIVMNPNYRNEIACQLQEQGSNVTLVDLEEA